MPSILLILMGAFYLMKRGIKESPKDVEEGGGDLGGDLGSTGGMSMEKDMGPSMPDSLGGPAGGMDEFKI